MLMKKHLNMLITVVLKCLIGTHGCELTCSSPLIRHFQKANVHVLAQQSHDRGINEAETAEEISQRQICHLSAAFSLSDVRKLDHHGQNHSVTKQPKASDCWYNYPINGH